MNNPSLADLAPGLADPVHDAQQVFRRLLDAMSRPGRIQSIDADTLAPPAGLGPAAAAVLLAIADPDLRVWFAPGAHTGPLGDWLRFHTGARIAASPADADWLVLSPADATPALWHTAATGTDEAPHTSATLLLEVPSLANTLGLRLTGPGIEHTQTLAAGGIAPGFWQERVAREADFPRGADLVLTCGHQLAALPRSTRITLEA
jgi:alpha-D-ribose 1-methylphosphonate 5-triphosphate synthase subunit PhnH